MSRSRFIESIAANIAYWHGRVGLDDPGAWRALDTERENLFRAVEYGLQQAETWPAAAELALKYYTYVFERGYWAEWALVLEQALATGPIENALLRGRLVQQLGSLYRRLRRLDDAQAAHEQAEALARAVDDPLLIAMAHLGLGRVHLRLRHYGQAERYARQSLAEFEAQRNVPDKVANAHNLAGIIAAERGDYEESVRELYLARDLFRQVHQPIELGRTDVNLTDPLCRLGRADEALALFDEAAKIFATHNLQIEHARLFIQLGFLHYSRDDLAQAEAAFRQAYSPFMRRVGPIYYRSLIEMNLGNALLQQGNLAKSRCYFLSAVNGFRLVDARTMLANSLDGLAETSLATGERWEAITLYEEALDIVAAIPENAFARRMEKRFRGLLEELRSSGDEEE